MSDILFKSYTLLHHKTLLDCHFLDKQEALQM